MFRRVLERLMPLWSLVLLAVVLIWVTISPPYTNRPPIRSDGAGYHLWTYAILRGDLNFKRYEDAYVWGGISPADPEGHHYHNKYGPGVALVRLPIMILLADPSAHVPPFSKGENIACLVLSALALLATAYLAFRSSRLFGLPDWAANLAVLAMVFGTGLFHFSTYDASYSHVWSALGLTSFLYLGLRALQMPEGRLPNLAVALLIAIVVLIRNSNSLAIALLTAVYVLEQFRRGNNRSRSVWGNVLAVGLGGFIGNGILVALNSNACGRLVLSSYADENFLWDRPMHLSVLVSLRQGLFVFYPIFAIVLGAGLVCRKTQYPTLVYGMLLLAYLFLYGYWECWWLGAGFGHRGFVELSPLAIPLLAAIFANLPRLPRAVLIVMAIAATIASWELMRGIWRGTLPWEFATRDQYWTHVVGRRSLLRWFY